MLTILGVLDLSVVVWVLGVAVGGHALGWTNLELLLSILVGVAVILGLRVWLAARLRRRGGNLA